MRQSGDARGGMAAPVQVGARLGQHGGDIGPVVPGGGHDRRLLASGRPLNRCACGQKDPSDLAHPIMLGERMEGGQRHVGDRLGRVAATSLVPRDLTSHKLGLGGDDGAHRVDTSTPPARASPRW